MKIIVVPKIQGTPARTNRRTGEIFISEWHFKKLDKVYQKFIVFHEMAHYLFQTKDEQFCDEFAVEMLLKEDYKIKKILKSVTTTLSNSNAHYGRKLNVFNLLRIHDFIDNNNTNVLKQI